jgi:hypothetical protein
MKFKKGDKVRMKDDHSKTDVVESVPGVEEYDKQGFSSADEGFVLKENSWERQEDWELIPESLKDVAIKIRVTPEQSRKVQEMCFKHGVYWCGGDSDVELTDKPFLFIDDGEISFETNENSFNNYKNTEVTYQEFMDRWGEEESKEWEHFKEDVMSFKKLTNFIKGMKQPLKTFYQLEWIEIGDDEYMPTDEGIEAMNHYNFMKEAGLITEKTFAEYAVVELRRRKIAEKKNY